MTIGKEKNMSKKKFLTKKKIFAGAVIGTIVYFSPQGGEYFKFLQTSLTTSSQVVDVEKNNDTKAINTSEKETKKEVKKETQEEAKEVDLRMRFIKNVLHVGNWPCKSKKDLEETIEKIRVKYSKKEVRIKYYKTEKDPYREAHSAQKLLKKEGFNLTVHVGDADE